MSGWELPKANLPLNQDWHGKHDDNEDDIRIYNSHQRNKTSAIEINLDYMHSKLLRSINKICCCNCAADLLFHRQNSELAP